MSIHLQKTDNSVVFLFGPTAVGKTDLLCGLFASGYEVVNADSVQVYRHLDIASAKADEKTRTIIPHHLIDILDPWENWNVADFIKYADDACVKIRSHGNVPVICGGTAYYFRHFLYGLSEAPAADMKIRRDVASFIEKNGLEAAYGRLCEVDGKSAQRINPNDCYRISRALEVYSQTGRPFSSFALPSVPRDNMKVTVIGLKRDKAELDARIRQRVNRMFEEGLIDEIHSLLDMGANSKWQSMQGIGYSEFITAAEACGGLDKVDFEKVKEQIVMDSIHYAKRQMTFFRSFTDVKWVHPEDEYTIRQIMNH